MEIPTLDFCKGNFTTVSCNPGVNVWQGIQN